MPFGIAGRTGSGTRQVIGFGDRSMVRGNFGAHLESATVTNGDFTVYVCDSASTTVGSAVYGNACGGPRHCCITWGSTLCKGRGFGSF